MSKTQSKHPIALIADDPWLEPYEEEIAGRIQRFQKRLAEIERAHGTLLDFAHAYQYFGINYDPQQKGWWYREWAPAAKALFLTGDFNQWNRSSHPLARNEAGIWEIFLSEEQYAERFVHGSLLKVHVVADNGAHDRIPAYIRRVVQNPETLDFAGQLWMPPDPYQWQDQGFDPARIQIPFIYESHVGMAQEKEGVGTYREFADNVLPRIARLGYNCIQLMAIHEHPYYGSFGYHVSNFFAPTSRFGTPEDLKYLIDTAHQMGIAVIMDVVHSHAVKNFAEGLNDFDGSGNQYFHEGGRGYHAAWDSKLFNYGKWEVQQFLLSNLAYWMEEFHFDGFRFDGVTSMLYFHHGDHITFDHYDKYFKEGVDWDAITYLQLANEVIHRIKPAAISIAEDMSGMPGTCRKVEEGGLGFDYRLGMGIPDYWIKLLKHSRDEDWNIHERWNVMTNRRYKEKTIAYAESHDQALVGDKTIAFWLMDKEMYWHMQVDDPHPVIDRGIALHKLIRFLTLSLGGEGYLNFMGNEFGHPEWIDFPREGNNWSYKYARRQWSLAEREDLKYKFLQAFDQAMLDLAKSHNLLASMPARQLNMDEQNQVIIFERNRLVFVFNFHPTRAIPDYRFYAPQAGTYQIVLNSDAPQFGGHDRIDESIQYETDELDRLSIYCTNRTALVLKCINPRPSSLRKAEKSKKIPTKWIRLSNNFLIS
ncbi:MAG: 1,4-alpha-glucan-branching enzyme [Bacteroidetes bacterium]|nr:MAG: 1,4-alpha-glucan-branching enzyme [Bacteroidota bacterium]